FGQLIVYRWTPSQRLTNEPTVDKHPALLYHNATLHVFWDAFDQAANTWRVIYRSLSGGVWSATEIFGDDGVDRKSPSILVDHTAHLWAFYLEKNDSRWQLKYVRQTDGGAWDLASAHVFPDDGGADPRVDSDVHAIFQPPESASDAVPRIWVFWTRKASLIGGQTGWEIAYRVATGLDPTEITWIHSWSPEFTNHLTVDTSVLPVDISFRTYFVNKPLDWGPIFTLPDASADFSAREPAAFINPDGALELFFSSDNGGSWSVWRASLLAADPPAWEAPERLTTGAYSHRAPFPAIINEDTLLFYRSNESVRYPSEVYRATETLDARYAGSTTVDTRNAAKIALREQFDDFQTYSYDAGKGDRNWYARDTVGIYLTADTEDQRVIIRNRNLITNILRQFMPAQTRVVFIIPITTQEMVYTYDFPAVQPQRVIGETYSHSMDAPSSEVYGGVTDEYSDTMVGWQFAFSWSEAHPEAATVDTAAEPVNTSLRTWHVGLQPGA
ncbi:MAG: hypothetical protein ACRDIB_00300, partial [Ardenticatenaceae bacterium]